MAIPRQHIRFATTDDGVRIAYATSGAGPPLVKAANWLSHLEVDWEFTVWSHWLRELSREHTLVRYDERGCGLSDWTVSELSFESWVRDLETVVDALQLERFPLLGISQGGAVAIAYAARHPQRVSHLVLYGAYARGRLMREPTPRQSEEARLMVKLIELGWGRENPAFRHAFTAQFIPGGTHEQLCWFDNLQRVLTSPANAARFLRTFNRIDVTKLAPLVSCPALVLHARHDERVPFDEGRLLAALIPGARFVPLDSPNHVLLDEPAWREFVAEMQGFLGAGSAHGRGASPARPAMVAELTERELEILDLIARGLDNTAIGTHLGVRIKTVRNHITSIFSKLSVTTRAQAIVRAREAGFGGEIARSR